jgi:hypothetical protein
VDIGLRQQEWVTKKKTLTYGDRGTGYFFEIYENGEEEKNFQIRKVYVYKLDESTIQMGAPARENIYNAPIVVSAIRKTVPLKPNKSNEKKP